LAIDIQAPVTPQVRKLEDGAEGADHRYGRFDLRSADIPEDGLWVSRLASSLWHHANTNNLSREARAPFFRNAAEDEPST